MNVFSINDILVDDRSIWRRCGFLDCSRRAATNVGTREGLPAFFFFWPKGNLLAVAIFAWSNHGLVTSRTSLRFSNFLISQGARSRGATTVTATLVRISYICAISFRSLRRHVPIYTIARNSRTKVTWCARYVLLDVLQYFSIVPPKTILKLWRRTISTMTTTWRCRMTWPISFFFSFLD